MLLWSRHPNLHSLVLVQIPRLPRPPPQPALQVPPGEESAVFHLSGVFFAFAGERCLDPSFRLHEGLGRETETASSQLHLPINGDNTPQSSGWNFSLRGSSCVYLFIITRRPPRYVITTPPTL